MRAVSHAGIQVYFLPPAEKARELAMKVSRLKAGRILLILILLLGIALSGCKEKSEAPPEPNAASTPAEPNAE